MRFLPFGSALTPVALLGFLAAAPTFAQTSASYKVEESIVNNGGNPISAAGLASATYRLTLDAVGDATLATALQSTTYSMDAGFVGRYAPPIEVQGLVLGPAPPFPYPVARLTWQSQPSAATYQVYRGALGSLPGTYGTCLIGNLSLPITSDTNAPPVGQGFFYMVTARNRLGEESPKGYRSDGTLQPNPLPCP